MRFILSILVLSSLLLAGCQRGEEGQAVPTVKNRNVAVAVNASAAKPCIDLNKASADELMELPGIGEATSRRIIAYREQHGRFRRPVEVILVEGFSEKKYRAIADRLCAEP
jgi:competence protein ComEA